jgi:hypothetical protein
MRLSVTVKTYHPRELAAVALVFGAGCLISIVENGGEAGHRGFVSWAPVQLLRKLTRVNRVTCTGDQR